jgi:hypothetical protein
VPTFGSYRTEPGCRCFGKNIPHGAQVFTS